MRALARAAAIAALLLASSAFAAELDYSAWTSLLQKHYDPAHGMDYANLKKQDAATLARLRQQLAKANVAAMNPKERLAYWINLYNVSVTGIVVDNYPVDSIRDISTDPIVRLNVFKKESVPFGNGMISLDTIENEKLREGFHDPRVHFAINCAARSCPPMRTEAFSGAHVDAQLDDQASRFLNGPHGIRLGMRGDTLVVHTTKIMDWFKSDFENWGGGPLTFVRKFLPRDKQRQIIAAGTDVDIEYDDYDWSLNDWKR